MVQPFDDSIAAAFDMIGARDEEDVKAFEAEKLATQAMVDQLETKYADRGLKFTQQFAGAVPVQAYGHLDGMRFYFRFRGNHGSLKVGPFVEELEVLYAQRVNEDIAARKQAQLDAGKSEDEIWEEFPSYPAAETDSNYYPHVIAKTASVQGKNPEDVYNGFLTNEEAHDMFIALVDSLEDVPEEKQLDEGLRVWLYEGRQAADAHWAARLEKIKAEMEAEEDQD